MSGNLSKSLQKKTIEQEWNLSSKVKILKHENTYVVIRINFKNPNQIYKQHFLNFAFQSKGEANCETKVLIFVFKDLKKYCFNNFQIKVFHQSL